MALSDYLSRTCGFSLRFSVFAAAFALASSAAVGGPIAFAQAAAAQAASADTAAARVALPQVQHTMPAGGSDAGALSVSQPVPSIVVTLKRSDAQAADLESFLTGLTTKGSDSYHKWLTPAQFAARFAPTADAVAPVRVWLQAQGFTVQSVSAGGMRLVASGTAAQVQATFAVSLHRYAMASGDSVLVTGTPTVPSAMAASIRAVSGLDSTSATSTEPVSVLADAVDANTTAVVVSDLATASASTAQLASVLEQASAQGQSVLVLHASAALMPTRALAIELATDIPAASSAPGATASAAATAASVATATPAATTSSSSPAAASDPTAPVNTTPRPDWQNAPGLPTDGLRAAPDAAVGTDTSALTAGIQSVVTKAGQRQGEVAAIFYQLAPEKGIFTHSDTTVPAGTWTAADGLGTVNVEALVKAWPFGVTAPNSTGIVLSSHTVTHGSNISLTANITGSNGTPTGTVQFASTQAGTLGTPVTLDANGSATYTTNALVGGQYGFFGTYNGDNTYAGSVTNTDTATINPEAAVVTGTTSGALMVGGTIPVTVAVKSASGVGQPAGVVMVYPYGTSIGSQTFNGMLAPSATAGTSTATVSVPATSGGTFAFQTNCTTDASFSCYQPSPFNVTIAKATPSVVLTQTGTATAANLSATVAAPAGSNSSSAVPTGYLQFMDGTQVLGGQTLNASGVATYSGPLGSGTTHSVTAVYPGDNNYNTANSNSTTPAKTTPTVALTAAAGSTAAAANLSATITPPAGSTTVATGTVQFMDGATALGGTAGVNGSGIATYSGALTGTGTTHSLTAVYSGDTNYNTQTSNAVSIGAGTVKPTVTLAATAGSTPTAATLNVMVAPPAGTTTVATGTVQFLDGATVLATNTLVNGATGYNGALTGTSSSHVLTAVYSGDATYASGTSNAVTIGTALINTTTALTSSSGYTGPAGTTFNLIALVSPASVATGGASPSGIITITDSVAGVVGTGTLASGTVTIPLSTLGVGMHSLVASYPGDGNYAASSSTPAVITVVTATATLAATLSPTGTVPYGYNATINATVTLPAGTTPPAGSVTATVSGGNGTYTATLSGTAGTAASTATISFPVPPPGTYTIMVTCSAGVNCAAQTLSITTTKGFTTTSVTSLTPTNPQAGVPVSVTATVANSGSGTGTYTYSGTVSFYSNGKFLCSAPVSNGVATCSAVFLSTASQLVTATYSGDTNWNGSTSTTGITVVPTPIPVTIALSANVTNAIVGQNVTLTAAVSSGVNNSTLVPSGSITFYDTFNGIVVNLGSAPLLSNGLNTSYGQLSTTGLQAGVHNIMAVYAGDSIFLQTTSSTLVINVGDFTVTFIPSSLQLSQGGTGTATALVSAVGSFAGQIALGCTPPPSSLSTCNIVPSVLTAGGTAQITVTTTASTAGSSQIRTSSMNRGIDASTRIAAAAGVSGLLSLLLLRRRRRIAALLLLLVMTAAMAGGCSTVDATNNSDGGTGTGGGGSGNNGTPLGTVNFTVTAASVTQPVNARHNFLLPVTTQ